MKLKLMNLRISFYLWLLVLFPLCLTFLTETNKSILIWRIRIVDFVDLVVLAPFFIYIFLCMHSKIFAQRYNSFTSWISLTLICSFMYGHAMHLTGNAINTYSTEIHNYISQIPYDTYELIYFFDEKLGHIILYFSLFLLYGIWMLESKLSGKAKGAFFCGLIGGLSYSISIIESTHPWLGFIAAFWLISCSIWSSIKESKPWFIHIKNNPLNAFGVLVAIFIIIGEILYLFVVGSFKEPSSFLI